VKDDEHDVEDEIKEEDDDIIDEFVVVDVLIDGTF
jgi:hypothetical protein